MKSIKRFGCAVIAVLMLVFSASCSEVPANTVFSAADLAGKNIGTQLGTTGDTFASDESVGAANIDRYNKGADAILALKTGKVDCVIIDEQPAKVFVEENSDLRILDEEFVTEDYAIAVAKDKTELVEAINGALQQLTESGVVAQVIANYIGDDTKGTCPYVSPENTDRSKGTLVMATNAAFKPYEYYENEKIVGIDAELALAICDLLGYELKIEDMDFDSIIAAVQSGKADFGMAGLSVIEDRLVNVNFSNPYTTSKQVIIVRAK